MARGDARLCLDGQREAWEGVNQKEPVQEWRQFVEALADWADANLLLRLSTLVQEFPCLELAYPGLVREIEKEIGKFKAKLEERSEHGRMSF